MRFEDSWNYLVLQDTLKGGVNTIPKKIQKITNIIDNKASAIIKTIGNKETRFEDSWEILFNL